ncbi:MAG: lipopolysaccharide biosynthesis protein [Candidatus Frackibacter sp. T328-2]|nr:MAG: lipopolysaccharide biosynthesis protein [Candidatus Frackibacter sp. T328-2]
MSNEERRVVVNEERYYDEYEIDLREYINLLWDGKGIIIGLFIAAILIAGLVSQFFIAPVYQTEAQFLAPSFTLLNDKEIGKGEYLSFFKNADIEEKIIRKFNLKKQSKEFSVENLEKLVKLSIKEDTNLVTVNFKDNDPQLAQKILNKWLYLFQERVIGFIEENNRGYLQNLKTSMNKIKRDYKIALNKWTDFKKRINLQLLVSQLQNKQQRLISFQVKVANLKMKIKSNNSQLKEVASQLNSINQFLVTEERISEGSLRKLELIIKDEKLINNLTTENEMLNPLYNRLQQQKSNLEEQLVAAESELASSTSEVKELKQDIANLQKQVADYRQQEELLQDSLKTSRNNYQSAKVAYNKARQRLNQVTYQINIVNSAIAPQNPVSPNTKLNIAIAGILALMLGVFIVFFKEFMAEDGIE